MLTQQRLKELLHYDCTTGLFTRKTTICNKKTGSVSGAKQNKGYVQIMIDGENYLAHRLAWFYVYGAWPNKQIDHINRIKTDNRIENLRDVSNSTNQHNNGLRKHNTTGITGVMYLKSRNVYVAQMYVNKKRIYLGTFKLKEDAISARKNYEQSLKIFV